MKPGYRKLPFTSIDPYSEARYVRGLLRTPQATSWDCLQAIHHVYPIVFDFLCESQRLFTFQAWDTKTNSSFQPSGLGGTATICMTYPFKVQQPYTLAHGIPDGHTRRCAVLLHEIGEALLRHTNWRDRCAFNLPLVSGYAGEAQSEAFCEAFALMILKAGANHRWKIGTLPEATPTLANALNVALGRMGLV